MGCKICGFSSNWPEDLIVNKSQIIFGPMLVQHAILSPCYSLSEVKALFSAYNTLKLAKIDYHPYRSLQSGWLFRKISTAPMQQQKKSQSALSRLTLSSSLIVSEQNGPHD